MLTELMSDQASADEMAARVANLPEIVRTMLRHPELFARQTDVGIQLRARGALTPRDRELAVLRIGWLCQAPYEFGEHVYVAKSVGKIGRAHVLTPVTNAHLVCRLLL